MPDTSKTPEVKIGPFTHDDQGSGRPANVVGGSEMDTPYIQSSSRLSPALEIGERRLQSHVAP